MNIKGITLGILLIVLGLGIHFYFSYLKKNTVFDSATIHINNSKFKLEIAQSPAQLTVGLGNRKSLCDHCGMIFIFGFDGVLPFWMKDTLIPLDMVWLDKNFEIVSIQTAQVEPDPTNPLKIYSNEVPARYVIELNSGTAKELNLKINDKIDLSPIIKQ